MSIQKGEEETAKLTASSIKEMDLSDFKYHKMTTQTVLAQIKSRATGLTQKEVDDRMRDIGPNELEKEDETPLWDKIKEQFEDQLARILLVSATISFLIAVFSDKDEGIAGYVEPFVILLILVLNAIVAIYQDNDAESALEALKDMQATKCQVQRDGKWSEVDSVELVPGDIVRVNMGNKIPADIRVLQMNTISLLVEEAPLTGESASVDKQVEQIEQSSEDVIQAQKNMLFASTIVNQGSATGVVIFTGMKTAIGRVQEQVKEAAEDEEDTPLKKALDDFANNLSWLIGITCLIVWLMNYKNWSDPIHGNTITGCIHYFKIAIALAVAAIPEGLPAVITTCLALGTRKMAKNNAIVRRLPSVETLGCTTVICSDKTGTLTKNQMCVIKFAVAENENGSLKQYKVQENKNSYDPTNCRVGEGTSFNLDFKTNMIQLFSSIATGCTINNSASVTLEDGQFKRMGEPTDAALKVFAEKLCGEATGPHDAFDFEKKMNQTVTKIATLDFSSDRKAMSTVVTGYRNEKDLLLKGAPDRILDKCKKFMTMNNKQADLNSAARKKIMEQISELSSEGLRVLALAEIPRAGRLSGLTAENKHDLLKDTSKYNQYEQDATFIGLVCIQDPVREEVKPAISQCKTAGIRVIMITGDSLETATAIAKQLDIIEVDQDLKSSCFTGAQFAAMSNKEKEAAVGGEGGKIFSRVEPAHKRELVKQLQEAGQVVAMTGDGVNDAPALKQAHIGIAMGITGTEVAKFASDMVLADDNFATIVKAVEQGRSIYSNMKAFIRYLISSNIGEVLSIFFTALLGIPEGFSSVQLLWVNLVTDGPPATALGFNPPDIDIMQKPPRKEKDSLLNNWTLIRYNVIGVYVGVATVGIFIYWYMFAETGDGHTLVTWYQLSHWGECPNWPKDDFNPVNFIDGLDFTGDKRCTYFTAGKVKASTLSLSVLVVIEMLNALNAISEDNSLLTMSPFINPYLILAILGSIGLHVMIVYVPMFAEIFGIAAMNLHEWGLVFAFSTPVIFIDEILKIFGRVMNDRELRARLNKKKKNV